MAWHIGININHHPLLESMHRCMFMFTSIRCYNDINPQDYLDVPDPLGPRRQWRDVPFLILAGPVPRSPRLVEQLDPHFDEDVVLQIFLFLQKKWNINTCISNIHTLASVAYICCFEQQVELLQELLVGFVARGQATVGLVGPDGPFAVGLCKPQAVLTAVHATYLQWHYCNMLKTLMSIYTC